MEKKYELTKVQKPKNGGIARRIRALRDIPLWGVVAGEYGGWIENESSLSHKGHAWVGNDAFVSLGSTVSDDALLSGNAVLKNFSTLGGRAWVHGRAEIQNSLIKGDSINVRDLAKVQNSEILGTNIVIEGQAYLQRARLDKTTQFLEVSGNARILATVMFHNEDRHTLIQGNGISIIDDVELVDVLDIKGDDIALGGHAFLKDISLQGSKIAVSGATAIEGDFTLGNTVEIRDAVKLGTVDLFQNYVVENITLTGDGEYLVENL